jgi:subfamily B ATP-binding cassette protein MsbA
MKRLKEMQVLLARYRGPVALNIGFNALGAVLSLFTFLSVVPFLRILFMPSGPAAADAGEASGLLDTITSGFDALVATHGTERALVLLCVAIVVLAVVKNAVQYAALFSLATIRTGIARDLRTAVYDKLLELPVGWFTDARRGDTLSRMTNDVNEVEFSIIGTIEVLFKSPLVILVSLATLFAMSWELTLFALVFLPVSGWLISRIAKALKHAARRGKDSLGDLMSLVDETLGGIRAVRGFNAEPAFRERFRAVNSDYFRLMRRLYKREYLASPMSETISLSVMAVLLGFGGLLVLRGEGGLSGEWFIGYLVVFSQIIPPARAISDGWFKLSKGAASLDRLDAILKEPWRIPDPEVPVPCPPLADRLRFEGVSFRYPGSEADVLTDVSFEVPRGATVALVGPSGSGKSTLAQLVARFADPTGGRILIDGVDLRDVAAHALRSHMGIVAQDPLLFNGTIADNIALGAPLDPDRLTAVAAAANALEFIDRLPDGFATGIGDGGGRLSGGQRQRLAIARALYRDPPLLLLDEATSALDTESEHLVQQAIDRTMAGRTSIVIAHRLSTVRRADLIVVLDRGRVVATGTHEDLMSDAAGLYRRLVEMQDVK